MHPWSDMNAHTSDCACHRYNDAVSYGELFLQSEYEMSVYNLDKADVAGQKQR